MNAGISWRALLPIASSLLEAAASPFGPLPLAFVTFAVESTEYVIDAVENGTDPVSVVQELEVRTAKLIEALKVGA